MGAPKTSNSTIDLQERDIELLRGLFECRIMTAAHVAAIYFDGKGEYTKKRLQKLKAAGLVGERKRRVNEPSILFLTRKAFNVLDRKGKLSDFPRLSANSFEARANVSELTIQHELEIMDVKAALHAALAGSAKFSIDEFSTWPLLNQFEVMRDHGPTKPVKPDGFIRIHEPEPNAKGYYHDLFLEVDRSHEVQDRLATKAVSYLDYYRSGGFAVRNGGTVEKLEKFPFRVLIVLQNAERRNNTAARMVQNNPPILSMTWLTTMAEVTNDPLGAIWIQPKTYRDVTTGTPYDTDRVLPTGVYRRDPKREAFIESKIQKRRLLE